MATLFLYHVVGDLTVGKPELSEFSETETVETAIRAIGESSEGGIPVWKKSSQKTVMENASIRQQRFVGILNALDVVAFLAREESLADQDKAMSTPVSEVVVHNNYALKVVDPGTRLIDALEMMKQGVKRLLVPKSSVWRGMSKRFSILYNGKWLKNIDPSGVNSTNSLATSTRPASSTSSIQDKFCCLSREDVLRFLIGCLGALAPLPLSSIASLGVINPNYCCIEASCPAIDATKKLPHDPCAVAVVEPTPDGHHKIIGEISLAKLWRCDYLATAWALANLSGGQFVMGVEDNNMSPRSFFVSSIFRPGLDSTIPLRIYLDEFVYESVAAVWPSGSTNTKDIVSYSRTKQEGSSASCKCNSVAKIATFLTQMKAFPSTNLWIVLGLSFQVTFFVGCVVFGLILFVIIKTSNMKFLTISPFLMMAILI
ncbi:hypothetical protein BUALT_Bualt01G0116700 [Buddleja alternifolia]|uniref:CBS domain-containing protein n=1 Tax=Buddleja alternifolia TaxID=168488 RepID=A0AAV6YE60_9LAMI|nr:hypothetical protein BUALT_Bualt01G0116700 [Buddleja alternifolia]